MPVRLDAIALSAMRSNLLHNEMHLSHGTSFGYHSAGSEYLVTARHNLTGRHAETGQPLHSMGSLPNRLQVLLTKTVPVIDSEDVAVSGQWLEFDLAELNAVGGLQVYGHAEGPTVDVACVGPFDPSDGYTRPVNHDTYNLTRLELSSGDECFVLGYPHFIDGGAPFLPIWKRGSIASYPGNDPPRLLIDTATRKGMSGAPVFVRRSGLITPGDVTAEQALSEKAIIGTVQDFVGCYSGRLGERDQLDSQLGLVWTRQVIEHIIGEKSVIPLMV